MSATKQQPQAQAQEQAQPQFAIVNVLSRERAKSGNWKLWTVIDDQLTMVIARSESEANATRVLVDPSTVRVLPGQLRSDGSKSPDIRVVSSFGSPDSQLQLKEAARVSHGAAAAALAEL